MTPLTDSPTVVIEAENGKIKSITTNISPNTLVVIKDSITGDDLGTMPYNVTAKAVVVPGVVAANIDELINS